MFISEPQIFLTDVDNQMRTVKHEYCYWLNSDDRLDPELPLTKSKANGGTMAMWRNSIDPYITVHDSQSSAILPLVLQLPGAKISVHIAIHLPTSGKESEFVSELANLQNSVEELQELYENPVIFIRGDGNCNPKNISRFGLLRSFIAKFSLAQVEIEHPTYHHFTGQGRFDSNLDIILYSRDINMVTETISKVFCKFDHPEVTSHHDLLLSEFTLPSLEKVEHSDNLVCAPRTMRSRSKIVWNKDGEEDYCELVSSQLQQLRLSWSESSSRAATSVILQSTNHILNLAATLTNPSVSMNVEKPTKAQRIPRKISTAKRRLMNKHKYFKKKQTDVAKSHFERARQNYRQAVRLTRLEQSIKRDQKLDTILTDNPAKIYSYLRSCKQTKTSKIDQLAVGEKLYSGCQVGDGFFDSMTSLKSCDIQSLSKDPMLTEHFSNYEHLMKICENKQTIPEISKDDAANILKRMKTHVIDIFGITALHYRNAGGEGLLHFVFLLNCIIADVNNGKVEELNLVLGLILYKGHRKDKNLDRSYRTISTCPFIAKGLDLYLRDLYQDRWDACTAPTQYQTTGSSHELASLLITEIVQHSLNITDQPVYFLVVDAQSAYDRCLRQILCTELFMAGISGSAMVLINNRLENRCTVYQWDGEMLGPASDITGFEQGGINSGDYYKLYNNSQLKSAQSSCLGVDMSSSTVSAVGQADDVILAANSIDSLRLLAKLTESYCSSYRVKLVSSKTKLLPIYKPEHEYLVEYAKLTNSVTIDDSLIKFVHEAEHVGVIRSTAGNMPHLLNRIAAHKKDLGAICSAGMARGQRGNPAASLRVHQLHATPVLLSGVATLVLNNAEKRVMEAHYKTTVQKLQRLHPNTPRAVVFFLAGTLPFEAVLHIRQLSLFSMVCHLPHDPLHIHAKYILTTALPKAKSWFQQILDICTQYGLPSPLQLLANPIRKETFKDRVKLKVTEYWQALLRMEAAPLTSLQYFKPELYSLTRLHYMWLSAASNPFECSKSTILAKISSGHFRTA